MNGRINSERDQLSMFVLDVMRHDLVEQVPSIVNLLNDDRGIGWRDCWPTDFTHEEVIEALTHLLRQGFVRAYSEFGPDNRLQPVDVDEVDRNELEQSLWFGLTDAGRNQWDNWSPPPASTEGLR